MVVSPDLTWPLRHAVRYHGDTEATIDGDVRHTYAEFGERVERLAAGLASLGVERGTRVATLLANSARYLELHLAVPGMGAIIVPLNSRLAIPEMEYILTDSGATVLIADEIHAPFASKLAHLVERVVTIPDEYETLVSEHEPVPLPGPASPEDPAGYYYTGGTTGPAKGVVLSHRALVAQATSLIAGFTLTPEDRYLFAFPLFHLGAICGVYAYVWQGLGMVFIPAPDPGALLRTIDQERISITALVPTLITMMLNHPDAATADLSSLRLVAHGAAPISPTLAAAAAKAFDCSLMQAYGMTEMSGVATLLPDEQLLLEDPRIRSAGIPIAGCEMGTRRPDGTPCDVDEPGEIVLRGPTMLSGYYNKPEETARALRDGWYWTGDMGYQDAAGYLYVVDRTKDMIVSGGENVYSVEVESALAAHPAVLEVAVIGVPDERWGERVHAIVVRRAGQDATAEELQAFCRERIAGYKTPKSVEFFDGELPKSAVGKILKRDLRAPYWEGAERGVN